ncbi:hypothetical protein EON66_07720, partial [archaeon]
MARHTTPRPAQLLRMVRQQHEFGIVSQSCTPATPHSSRSQHASAAAQPVQHCEGAQLAMVYAAECTQSARVGRGGARLSSCQAWLLISCLAVVAAGNRADGCSAYSPAVSPSTSHAEVYSLPVDANAGRLLGGSDPLPRCPCATFGTCCTASAPVPFMPDASGSELYFSSQLTDYDDDGLPDAYLQLAVEAGSVVSLTSPCAVLLMVYRACPASGYSDEELGLIYTSDPDNATCGDTVQLTSPQQGALHVRLIWIKPPPVDATTLKWSISGPDPMQAVTRDPWTVPPPPDKLPYVHPDCAASSSEPTPSASVTSAPSKSAASTPSTSVSSSVSAASTATPSRSALPTSTLTASMTQPMPSGTATSIPDARVSYTPLVCTFGDAV